MKTSFQFFKVALLTLMSIGFQACGQMPTEQAGLTEKDSSVTAIQEGICQLTDTGLAFTSNISGIQTHFQISSGQPSTNEPYDCSMKVDDTEVTFTALTGSDTRSPCRALISNNTNNATAALTAKRTVRGSALVN